MDQDTYALFAVVVALGLNFLLMRIAFQRGMVWLMLVLQVLQVTIGFGVIIYGLPGFEHAPAVKWVVGLVFILHAADNIRLRTRMARRSSDARRRIEEAQRTWKSDDDDDDDPS